MDGTINGRGKRGRVLRGVYAAVLFLFFQLAGIGFCSFLPRLMRYAGPAATGLLTLGFIMVWMFFSVRSLAGIGRYLRHTGTGHGVAQQADPGPG